MNWPGDALELREKAANAFLLAASALVAPYPFPRTTDKAASLIHAAHGIFLLAKMDPRETALDIAISEIRRILRIKR
jgi:hypothetical protein